MKASSESGLCALTISRQATEVICWTTHPVYNSAASRPSKENEKRGEKVKGRSSVRHVNWKPRWRSSDLRFTRRAANRPHKNPIAQNFLLPCSPAADEAAPIVARFYWFHLPPAPVGRLDSTSSFAPAGMLVNGSEGSVRLSKKRMFRSLFSRKDAPLAGAPAVRRLKTYSARSGYVYQYR